MSNPYKLGDTGPTSSNTTTMDRSVSNESSDQRTQSFQRNTTSFNTPLENNQRQLHSGIAQSANANAEPLSRIMPTTTQNQAHYVQQNITPASPQMNNSSVGMLATSSGQSEHVLVNQNYAQAASSNQTFMNGSRDAPTKPLVVYKPDGRASNKGRSGKKQPVFSFPAQMYVDEGPSVRDILMARRKMGLLPDQPDDLGGRNRQQVVGRASKLRNAEPIRAPAGYVHNQLSTHTAQQLPNTQRLVHPNVAIAPQRAIGQQPQQQQQQQQHQQQQPQQLVQTMQFSSHYTGDRNRQRSNNFALQQPQPTMGTVSRTFPQRARGRSNNIQSSVQQPTFQQTTKYTNQKMDIEKVVAAENQTTLIIHPHGSISTGATNNATTDRKSRPTFLSPNTNRDSTFQVASMNQLQTSQMKPSLPAISLGPSNFSTTPQFNESQNKLIRNQSLTTPARNIRKFINNPTNNSQECKCKECQSWSHVPPGTNQQFTNPPALIQSQVAVQQSMLRSSVQQAQVTAPTKSSLLPYGIDKLLQPSQNSSKLQSPVTSSVQVSENPNKTTEVASQKGQEPSFVPTQIARQPPTTNFNETKVNGAATSYFFTPATQNVILNKNDVRKAPARNIPQKAAPSQLAPTNLQAKLSKTTSRVQYSQPAVTNKASNNFVSQQSYGSQLPTNNTYSNMIAPTQTNMAIQQQMKNIKPRSRAKSRARGPVTEEQKLRTVQKAMMTIRKTVNEQKMLFAEPPAKKYCNIERKVKIEEQRPAAADQPSTSQASLQLPNRAPHSYPAWMYEQNLKIAPGETSAQFALKKERSRKRIQAYMLQEQKLLREAQQREQEAAEEKKRMDEQVQLMFLENATKEDQKLLAVPQQSQTFHFQNASPVSTQYPNRAMNPMPKSLTNGSQQPMKYTQQQQQHHSVSNLQKQPLHTEKMPSTTFQLNSSQQSVSKNSNPARKIVKHSKCHPPTVQPETQQNIFRGTTSTEDQKVQPIKQETPVTQEAEVKPTLAMKIVEEKEKEQRIYKILEQHAILEKESQLRDIKMEEAKNFWRKRRSSYLPRTSFKAHARPANFNKITRPFQQQPNLIRKRVQNVFSPPRNFFGAPLLLPVAIEGTNGFQMMGTEGKPQMAPRKQKKKLRKVRRRLRKGVQRTVKKRFERIADIKQFFNLISGSRGPNEQMISSRRKNLNDSCATMSQLSNILRNVRKLLLPKLAKRRTRKVTRMRNEVIKATGFDWTMKNQLGSALRLKGRICFFVRSGASHYIKMELYCTFTTVSSITNPNPEALFLLSKVFPAMHKNLPKSRRKAEFCLIDVRCRAKFFAKMPDQTCRRAYKIPKRQNFLVENLPHIPASMNLEEKVIERSYFSADVPSSSSAPQDSIKATNIVNEVPSFMNESPVPSSSNQSFSEGNTLCSSPNTNPKDEKDPFDLIDWLGVKEKGEFIQGQQEKFTKTLNKLVGAEPADDQLDSSLKNEMVKSLMKCDAKAFDGIYIQGNTSNLQNADEEQSSSSSNTLAELDIDLQFESDYDMGEMNYGESSSLGFHPLELSTLELNTLDLDTLEPSNSELDSLEVNTLEVDPFEMNSFELNSFGTSSYEMNFYELNMFEENRLAVENNTFLEDYNDDWGVGNDDGKIKNKLDANDVYRLCFAPQQNLPLSEVGQASTELIGVKKPGKEEDNLVDSMKLLERGRKLGNRQKKLTGKRNCKGVPKIIRSWQIAAMRKRGVKKGMIGLLFNKKGKLTGKCRKAIRKAFAKIDGAYQTPSWKDVKKVLATYSCSSYFKNHQRRRNVDFQTRIYLQSKHSGGRGWLKVPFVNKLRIVLVEHTGKASSPIVHEILRMDEELPFMKFQAVKDGGLPDSIDDIELLEPERTPKVDKACVIEVEIPELVEAAKKTEKRPYQRKKKEPTVSPISGSDFPWQNFTAHLTPVISRSARAKAREESKLKRLERLHPVNVPEIIVTPPSPTFVKNSESSPIVDRRFLRVPGSASRKESARNFATGNEMDSSAKSTTARERGRKANRNETNNVIGDKVKQAILKKVQANNENKQLSGNQKQVQEVKKLLSENLPNKVETRGRKRAIKSKNLIEEPKIKIFSPHPAPGPAPSLVVVPDVDQGTLEQKVGIVETPLKVEKKVGKLGGLKADGQKKRKRGRPPMIKSEDDQLESESAVKTKPKSKKSSNKQTKRNSKVLV